MDFSFNFLHLKGSVITAICLLAIVPYCAQDTHYWTQQFGSRSALLGGAVVGGVRDNSAVYYNPGALAQIDSLTVSVSANAYQLDKFDMPDGAGAGLDLNSSQTQIIPLMISGLYRLKNAHQHTFGYSIIGKQQNGIKFSARRDGKLNVIQNSNSPGDEEFIAQYNLKTGLNEQLFGLTYAYQFNQRFSLGVTNYVAYRTQYLEESAVCRAIPDIGSYYYDYVTPLVASNYISSFEFNNIRALWKLGFSLDLDRLKLGLTITTPSLNLGGKAMVNTDFSLYDMNINGSEWSGYISDFNNDSLLIYDSDNFQYWELLTFTGNDRQQGLKTVYKSPLSIALGAQYSWDKTTICGTMEWFQSVPLYDQVIPKNTPFGRPTWENGDLTSDQMLALREGSKTVTNIAVGIDQQVTAKLHLLAGARSNFSHYEPYFEADGNSMSYTTLDLYHVTLGALMKREKSDMSVGISYGFGSDNAAYQPVNFSNSNELNYLFGEASTVTANFSTIGLIIGYTYYLK